MTGAILAITRDGGRYVITAPMLEVVKTDSLDEVGAAIAHFFGTDKARHDIFKRRGLCPYCEAMKREAKEE